MGNSELRDTYDMIEIMYIIMKGVEKCKL